MMRTRHLTLPLAGLLALLSCKDTPRQTGIVVEVTTDLSVPVELDEVAVNVTGSAGDLRYDQSFPLAGGPVTYDLPVRVGLQPRGDATASFRVEAVGRRAGGRVVSSSATLSFPSDRIVLLQLPLRAICVGVVCPQATTCVAANTCALDGVAPTTLPPYQPGADAGTGATGGTTGVGGRGGTTGVGGGGASGTTGVGGGGASGTTGVGGRGGTTGVGGRGGTTGVGGGGASGTTGVAGRGGSGGGTVVPSLNDQLVGYWSFDQSSTSFPDHSGNGNNVTSLASYWTSMGAFGGALDLTAPNSGAGVPGSASVNAIVTSISITAFARPPAPGAVRTIISRYLGSDYWKLGFSDNGALRFTAGPSAIQTGTVVSDSSRWTHVAATYDGVMARLYVGGTLAVSATFGPVSLVGGPPTGGGYGPFLGGTFMDITADTIEDYGGQVDELTLHSRALTADEVNALSRGIFPTRR